MEAKHTILIVDDEPYVHELMEGFLFREGYKLAFATSGQEALDYLNEHIPDLILMDVMMPNLDGFETCRCLKARETFKVTPVIFMTALTDVEAKVRGFDVGGVDYVTKPIQSKEVIARIKTHLAIHNRQMRLLEENTCLREKEETLRESEERYALAARGANDGLWDWDLQNDQIYFSPRWKIMLGYQEDELDHSLQEWFSRVHAHDLKDLKAQIQAHLDGHVPHLHVEYRLLHGDGTYHWMLCRGLAVWDAHGRALRLAGSQTDITNRKETENQLQYDSTHDPLTNLPNRSFFMEHLAVSITRAKEEPNYLFALLFIDLDRFKVVNDSLGHIMGDKLLFEVARRLEACTQPKDIVARLGGDEFTILLTDVKQVSDTTRIATRVQDELAKPINLGEHEIIITASIGITLSEHKHKQPLDFLRDADAAMYKAKASGRARYEVFDSEWHPPLTNDLGFNTDLCQTVQRADVQATTDPM